VQILVVYNVVMEYTDNRNNTIALICLLLRYRDRHVVPSMRRALACNTVVLLPSLLIIKVAF
jgi:hypothetical protein